MVVTDGKNEKRVPLWATVSAAVVITALPAGIAWGVGQARLEALEHRVSVVERKQERSVEKEDLKAIDKKLEDMRGDLTALLIALKVTGVAGP
jgi:hypothetical protein